MKCFYHNDLDGKCAGAIVYHHYKALDIDVKPEDMIEINYNMDFPFNTIKPDEEIYIVDFSLQKEGEFEKLLKTTKNIIWIDHHKTAIEKHPNINVKGIRKDGIAGCVLTWDYFYHGAYPVPLIVEMLGDYDVWDFSRHGENLTILQTGISLFNTSPYSDEWRNWLSDSLNSLPLLLEKGETALNFRTNMYKQLIKSWSFFAEFEGYKAVCCNVGSTSSQLFDSVKDDYDLMMPFVFDGKQWTVSIYTKKEIDCSVLAKKYGGGGHKKASGFQCKDLPFKS